MNDDKQPTNTYNSQQMERHRAMTSPESIVADAVLEACNSPIRAKTRITEGFSNEVYAVTTADGQRVVVRIHWYGSLEQTGSHFEPERWALVQCARIGLPTPWILLLKTDDSTELPRSICVETYLDGTTLHSLVKNNHLDVEQAHPIVVEAGTLLARLHTVPAQGFGRIDGRGVGAAPDWEVMLNRIPIAQLRRAARNVGIDSAEVDDARDLLYGCRDLWHDLAPRLLHGDYSPQHILVRDGRVSGMIDLEFPQSGDPAMDLAYWGYWSAFHCTSFPLSWLLEGYRQHAPVDVSLERRIVACRLQHTLDTLGYHGIEDCESASMRSFLRTCFHRDMQALRQYT
ncbi:MAG: phosphotransferase [Anaerolineae bacterium]|nr:phosphotransferase [Anaerolineae bacterium]